MSRMSIILDDEILGLFVLLSLPESWETFYVNITSYAPRGVISSEMDKRGILNDKMRRKAYGSSCHFDFSLKIEGRVRKRNQRVVDRIIEATPSRDTRI